MRKILSVLMICCLTLGLLACGNMTSANKEEPGYAAEKSQTTKPSEENTIRAVNSDLGGVSYVIEGSSPSIDVGDHYVSFENPIILLDNENLAAEMLGTFEMEYGAKDNRRIGRGATIRFTNRTEEEILLGMVDAYIGDSQITASNFGSPNKCLPGKTVQMNYIFYTTFGSEEHPVEHMEDVLNLSATITADRFTDKDTITKYLKYTFSVAEGELEEKKTEAPAEPEVYKAFEPIQASPTEDQVFIFEEPILLLENQYVKVEIIEFFQKNVNWTDEKGPRMERGITLKTTNKYHEKLMVDIYDLYIGDKQIKDCMLDGSITPIAGKAEINGFYLWDHAGHIDKNLEDINEMYHLEGSIEVKEYGGNYLGEYRFTLP